MNIIYGWLTLSSRKINRKVRQGLYGYAHRRCIGCKAMEFRYEGNVMASRICRSCKLMEFWDLETWKEIDDDGDEYNAKKNLLEMLDEYEEEHGNEE